MPSDRALLEQQMAGVELRPFTIDEFHRRRHRKQRNRRIVTTVMGVVLAAAAIGGVLQTVGTSDDKKVNTDDAAGPIIEPASPFVGSWVSTDTDGSSQTMEIQPTGTGEYAVELNDEVASAACAGAPATLTGIGQVQTDGTLVAAMELACDDGSTPVPLQSDPASVEAFLAGLEHMTFEHDPATDELVDGSGILWWHPGNPGPVNRAAQPMDITESVPLIAGTRYSIDPDGDDSTPLRVTYDVAAEGWSSWPGAAKPHEDGHTLVSITTVDNVVTDACDDHRPADPPVGPSVDDLVAALTALAPFEVTAPPSDVTLLGYQGKHLQLTVPDMPAGGGNFPDCDDGQLHTWISKNTEGSFFGYNAEPGRTEDFWILDVDGTRLMIAINSSPAMPSQDLEEAQAIFDSIQFET